MRGTWQGSGTWQASGPGAGPVLAAAVIAAFIALERLLARLWWLLAGTALLAAAGIAGYVALLRWAARHDTRPGTATPAGHAIPAAPSSQVTVATPPAIVNNYGPQIHVHGRDGEESAARIIRQAIPGPSGGATTEKE